MSPTLQPIATLLASHTCTVAAAGSKIQMLLEITCCHIIRTLNRAWQVKPNSKDKAGLIKINEYMVGMIKIITSPLQEKYFCNYS